MLEIAGLFGRIAAAQMGFFATVSAETRLTQFSDYGDNPGHLGSFCFVPRSMRNQAPLVVVLHGCGQTAAGYDAGSGWSQLAEEHGFALLYPEQHRSNHSGRCFNWYRTEDIARDSGEALSIAQMVRGMIATYDLNPTQVFVTGLSAGGAMTAVMMATYPEIFAGGGIIAGLPYGCASSLGEALDRMRGSGLSLSRKSQETVRSASSHDGPWPTLSIWHGTDDRTVDVTNMASTIAQWKGLHGLSSVRSTRTRVDGHWRSVWRDEHGISKIEAFSVQGMGHGAPLNQCDDIGNAQAYMLNAGISSTQHMARYWQLF